MLGWCALLFILGIIAFMDSLFNYGEIFRRINSVLFLLISLGLLVRTSMKIRLRQIENLTQRVKELETINSALGRNSKDSKKKQSTF